MPVIRISEELFKEVQKYAEPLVDNFETALWKALGKSEGIQLEVTRRKKSHAIGNLTSPKDYWNVILEVLVAKGGRATRTSVYEEIEKRMNARFKPGDYEQNLDGSLKWRKQVDYQRLAMVHKGLLGRDSSVGIWEITDLGRKSLLKS